MAGTGTDTDTDARAAKAPTGGGRHGTEMQWGCADVPLLPRWHRQAFVGCDTPAAVRTAAGVETLDSAGAGWAASGRIPDQALASLAAAVDGFPPPPQTVVAADSAALVALPLRARTRAALRSLDGDSPVTVASLLSLPGFGTFALLDAMCAAEAAETPADVATPAGLPEVRRLAAQAAASLDGLLDVADSVDRVAAEHRLAADPPSSLAAAARVAGCSRETVRRRERRLRAAAEASAGAAAAAAGGWIRHRLGLAASAGAVAEAVAECVSGVPAGQSRRIVEGLIRGGGGYRPVGPAAMMVTADGSAAVAEISAAAERLSDDTGLVAQAALAAEFSERAWAGSLGSLCAAAGLVGRGGMMHSGTWTASAAVKAALIERGRPADAATLGDAAGISTVRASAVLSQMPSAARADKSRWGLRQWRCGEYRGIAAEMQARIETLGGAASMPDLAAELSQLYNVARDSVWAIAHTPQFELDTVNRTVAVARNPTVDLGNLNDVASGRVDGEPYWRFRVTAGHLRGVSIASVPGEVAAALGCGVGGRTTAQVRSPSGCGPVSVIWRAACVTGPEIGRGAQALTAAGCGAGRHARVVIHADGAVSFAAADG